MDSRRKSDPFSYLPDCLVVSIISLLPFKQSVQTSVLAKRWRNLCRETTNLVFKESEFENLSVVNTETIPSGQSVLFADIMRQWILRFNGEVIERFELCLSEPSGFEEDIASLIEFAASKQTKNLVIDFSIPVSRNISVIQHLLTLIYYQRNPLDISRLVFNLIYVRNLTICSFILQMIQDCPDPMELHEPMKIRHLVMKTNMHANEFVGMTIFLNSCPEMESLTFDTITTQRIVRVSSPLDPKTYWLTNTTYECLEKTLKVVEVKNFRGGSNELHVLQYLIRTGRVMERVDLYEAKGLNHDQRMSVRAVAEELKKDVKKGSRHLRITLHNAIDE